MEIFDIIDLGKHKQGRRYTFEKVAGRFYSRAEKGGGSKKKKGGGGSKTKGWGGGVVHPALSIFSQKKKKRGGAMTLPFTPYLWT